VRDEPGVVPAVGAVVATGGATGAGQVLVPVMKIPFWQGETGVVGTTVTGTVGATGQVVQVLSEHWVNWGHNFLNDEEPKNNGVQSGFAKVLPTMLRLQVRVSY